MVLAPVLVLALYIEVAAAADRAYRSAQIIPPSVGPVIGDALLGAAGPVAGVVVALACLHLRRFERLPIAVVAAVAESVAAAVAFAAGLSMLHAGVT